MRRARLVCVCLFLLGCQGHMFGRSEQAPPGSIVIRDRSQVVKVGQIGVKNRQPSSYVFVDVENHDKIAREVAVDGILRDGAGTSLGTLQMDSLRIPSGDTRTFALVLGKVAPGAVSATFRLRGAAPAHKVPVTITDVRTEKDHDRLAATLKVRNTGDRPIDVTVICTFYGSKGQILSRPFVILAMDPRSSRPFRFLGPPGAVKAQPFLGDVLF